MQFHLDGFRAGDPDVQPALDTAQGSGRGNLPPDCDVLIVGCGPAGLTLAAQLSAFPHIRTCIVEQKPGPLELGQADGVACRTMEMFNAFGFVERVLREAYWVNETTFWRPSESNRDHIALGDWIKDTETGLSQFPHVILNQARVHGFYLDVMKKSARRLEPFYARRLTGLTIDPARPITESAVRVEFDHDGAKETMTARYVVGCDGARSMVRQSLGLELKGDAANQAWGVMDILATTDFPDWRCKAVINSTEGGIVLIPREGGYLVRIYVEMDKLGRDERVRHREWTFDDILAAARKVLRPYTLEVKDVAWWSVYEIGQRMCDRFDDVPERDRATRTPRVFIAGDACHTHSPKAGQGMNVSMQDAFNLGWKLAAVLEERSPPDLLHSYTAERHAIARELIDFDREWSSMLSAPVRSPSRPDGIDPTEVQAYFVRHGRYSAGTMTRYEPSQLILPSTHQHLATGFVVGTRFHSAPVVRMTDARPMHLGDVNTADGKWRLIAFADATDTGASQGAIARLCAFLEADPASPAVRFTPTGRDVDAVIDLRAIFQQPHRALRLADMPGLLLPYKGALQLRDYEKIYCSDVEDGNDIFDMRGIDRARGCIVIVRPDQYVAGVLPLDDHAALGSFFDGFMQPAG